MWSLVTFLFPAVEEFNDLRISKTVLERLLKQNIYFHIKIKNKEQSKTDDPSTILFERVSCPFLSFQIPVSSHIPSDLLLN